MSADGEAAPQLTGGAAVLARMRAQRAAAPAAAAAPPPAASEPEAAPEPQLTGSAALLARMRKSRAVTGEAAAAPSAAAPAGGAGSAGAVGEARTSFDGTLYVLYGGEAATQVAAELADGARRAGLAPQLVAAADFRNLKLESEPRVALFVVETVENAQPAEAAGSLVRHFNRRRKEAAAGAAPLAGLLRFAVLGLGDTNLLLDRQTTTAKDCNQAAAALDGALRALGALPLCARGEANDAVGLHAAVEPWADALWPKLQTLKAEAAAAAQPQQAATAQEASHPAALHILYGSQTGNSAEIARNLGAAALERGVPTRVCSMDETAPDAVLRPGAVLLFVVSSTGDGDPPDNCASFYARLRKLKSEPAARGVQYAVLGLGDQNYTKFMAVPRYFSARLEALGGAAFAPRGEADETEGLFEYVDAWTDKLWPQLDAALKAAPAARAAAMAAAGGAEASSAAVTEPVTAPVLASAAPVRAPASAEEAALAGVPPLAPCRVALRWLSADEAAAAAAGGARLEGTPPPGDGGADGRFAPDAPLYGTVAASTRLTAQDSDRCVVHLEFDTGSRLAFQPGDSLGVLPEVDPACVAALASRLGADVARVLALDPPGALPHLRSPVRCGAALARCVDSAAPPRRAVLRALAEHCSSPAERLHLLMLSSRGGRAAYDADVAGPRASLLDVLQAHPSCAPPLAVVLDALPPLAPRLYSIAAAPEVPPGRPAVAFSRVAFANGRAGVATGWLAGLACGASVPLFLRPGGAFTPPADPDVPMVMIGPGTGVAPFRGFLQRRAAQRAASGADAASRFAPAWLFFGCRSPEEDFLYRAELQAWAADGTLTHLVTAFSRPPGAQPDAPKTYVQHRMAEHGAALAALIAPPATSAAKPAVVYVCGDGAGMAKGVHAALLDILERHAGLSAADAVAALAEMGKIGRYVRDIWSS